MRLIKQKWKAMSNIQKVRLLSPINIFVVTICIFMLFLIKPTKISETALLAMTIFASANASINLSLVFLVKSKEHNMSKRFKEFMYYNFALWIFYSAYLCLLAFTLNFSFLLVLCFLYLEVAIEIWINQYVYCRLFINEYLSKRLLTPFNIKVVHSILIAINSWLIIILNLRSINRKSDLWPVIYAIISSSTILFYPSFDIFGYISKEINKFDEQNHKEKIESESNGSKNYTA